MIRFIDTVLTNTHYGLLSLLLCHGEDYHLLSIVYYDKLAKTIELARWHWQRTYSLGTNFEFHRRAGSYFIKDDHDTWMNDCWPSMESKFMGDFTFKQGLAVFLEQVPMGKRTYRTFRWGKDLQIWLVEALLVHVRLIHGDVQVGLQLGR